MMHRINKKIAWIQAQAVLFLALSAVSCSETDPVQSVPVLDSETELSPKEETFTEETFDERLSPNIEVMDLRGMTFCIFGPKDTGGDWQLHDMVAEELNGEVLNDEIYRRNEFLQQTYNFEIALPDPSGSSAAELIIAGDSTYQAIAINAFGSVQLAADGMLLNMDELNHIDFSQSYWSPSLTQPLSVDGRIFMATGDITVVPKEGVRAFYFNKDLLEDYHLDNPYDIVREGKWTIEKMFSMIGASTSDLDGNGTMNENDRYGLIGQGLVGTVLYQGSGESLASGHDTEMFALTAGSERSVSAMLSITELISEERSNIHMSGDWQGLLRMFENHQGLFYTEVMLHIETMRGYDVDFGIIPSPKYDEQQENYSHYLDRGCNLFYSIPVTSEDPDTAAYILEAIAAASRSYVTPAYYDVCLKSKYARDEESAEMLDIIFSTYHLELAEVYGWGGLSDYMNTCMNDGGNVSSILKTISKRTEKAIKETVTKYRENDNWQ